MKKHIHISDRDDLDGSVNIYAHVLMTNLRRLAGVYYILDKI